MRPDPFPQNPIRIAGEGLTRARRVSRRQASHARDVAALAAVVVFVAGLCVLSLAAEETIREHRTAPSETAVAMLPGDAR